MINHEKNVKTLQTMLADVKFNQNRHNARNWQKAKRDSLAIVYDNEIEALEYAIGVLTQKICFSGRNW